MDRTYEWYLHGWTQAKLSQPSPVSTPPRPEGETTERGRVAFALGVHEALEEARTPGSKASVLAVVESAFAPAEQKEQS